MIYAQNNANNIRIKLCIVQKKTDNPAQINAVVMPAKNCFVVMKERKKRRNRFVAIGRQNIILAVFLYLELCDGQNDVLCAQTQEEKMDFTRCGDERYNEII